MNNHLPDNPKSAAQRQISVVQTADEIASACAPHQMALLGLMAVADRNQLDLNSLVTDFSLELPNRIARRMNELVVRMEQGDDPIDAVANVQTLLPPSCVLALELAREDETLPALFFELTNRQAVSDGPPAIAEDRFLPKLSRLAARTLFICAVLGFILLKIVPEFQMMIQEFNMEPPVALRRLLVIGAYVPWIASVTSLVLLVLLPFYLWNSREYLNRWNPLTWRQKRVPEAVSQRRSLAMVAQTGRTVADGVSLIRTAIPFSRLARRLATIESKLDNDGNSWQALANKRLVSNRDATALELTGDGDTRAWLLRWSADALRNRSSTRWAFISRLFLAVVHIGLGILVLITCIAVLMTLISIMNMVNYG